MPSVSTKLNQKKTIGFVLKGYPRLSETFIAQEIHALEKREISITLFSLRHPTDKSTHPIHQEIKASVTYLPEYLHQEPLRLWKAWKTVCTLKGYPTALNLWWSDLKRDPTPNRIRRFGQALVLAAELPDSIKHLHFHFLHTPASVTRYAAIIKGLSFSGSAHAKDIYTIPDWDKAEKLRDSEWITTCTQKGAENLRALNKRATAQKVFLDYHGLDLKRFPSPAKSQQKTSNQINQNCKKSSEKLTILSIGRAVEKKGYDDLLKALKLLPKTLSWHFIHIGGGKQIIPLKKQAHRLGLERYISWHGAQDQIEILNALARADIFVLANKIAQDGDRDGLPNVLMEAQSQAIPVIATKVSATPELIINGETGLLIEPNDPQSLANAILFLAENTDKRHLLGLAGEKRVRSLFGLDHCIQELAMRLKKTISSNMTS